MADVGFKIYNKFYPLVLMQDWNWGDFSLSHRLTDIPADELFSSKADAMLLQQVLIAVAVGHARSDMTQMQIIDMIQKLKPSEVEEVGFEVIIEDDDAGPPDEGLDEAKPSDSSESSTPSGDENPESEKQERYGKPGWDTGSPE